MSASPIDRLGLSVARRVRAVERSGKIFFQQQPDTFSGRQNRPVTQLKCPLLADFVAEVSCGLFWLVIPSL
jgi:hypothetical protein